MSPSFRNGMKRLMIALFAALAAASMLADDTAPAKSPMQERVDRLVRDSIPVCGDTKISRKPSPVDLPSNFTGTLVQIESDRPACEGQYITVLSNAGGFYLGTPWTLKSAEGATLEEKLKNFTWTALKDSYEPTIDRTRTADGLFRVTLNQTTERGKVPLEGEIDPAGTVFFLGHFHRIDENLAAARLKAFEPHLGHAPSTGPAKSPVTVIEFSDFECPSCQHASGYLKPILSKFPDRVRYIRFDLPLMSSHPWAFAAAIAGRAIYRQKPEAFWDYKTVVYSNQAELTAFTIDDFTRNFAKDHDLDMQKYDADINSQEVRDEILRGIGAAFSNDIRATPTYVVNGVLVDAGPEGKSLAEYVGKLVK